MIGKKKRKKRCQEHWPSLSVYIYCRDKLCFRGIYTKRETVTSSWHAKELESRVCGEETVLEELQLRFDANLD